MPGAIYGRHRYTREEAAYFRANYASKSRDELARDLGRTPEAMTQRAHKTGISKRLCLSSCEAELRRLHALRLTDREMAEKLGVSNDTVSLWRKQLGLTPALSRSEAGRRGIRGLNAKAKSLGSRTWSRYLRERQRVRCEMAWPGCRTPTEVRVCQALFALSTPCGSSELAARLDLCSGATLRGLRVLIALGVVCRRKDGRHNVYHLSPEAAARAESRAASQQQAELLEEGKR